jgi:uncharacterized protein YukE
MYGDTSVIRAQARAMHQRAGDLRAEADDLAGRVEAVPWTGLAADAMRRVAHDHAARLRSCADAHDSAADALLRHAREVDHLKEVIAAIEHRVLHLIDAATSGLAGLAGRVVPGAIDHWLDHFDPPPSGSRAWLDVHVPRAA